MTTDSKTMRWSIVALICSAVLWWWGSSRPPQIGVHRDGFAAVMNLRTALAAKRSDLLARTSQEIERVYSEKKLNNRAYRSLQSIIADAQAGRWEDAFTAINRFMVGQRAPSALS